MSGKEFNVVITSDSAGATLAVNVVLKILEHNNMAHIARKTSMPLPLALVLNYAALDFNFTSWMNEENLRVLRAEESSGNLPGLRELAKQKDHLKHIVRSIRLSKLIPYLNDLSVSAQYGRRQRFRRNQKTQKNQAK